MRDVQNETDNRNMAIDRVGIRDISWPISVPDRTNGTQETVAQVSLSVSLPAGLPRHAHEPLCRGPRGAGEARHLS